jgi:methylmalonyl-CoA/ethylmalonyl-CoA epimerase
MNANNPNWALSDIGQIGLTVSDLEKAVAFYRDALGLKHLFNAPPDMAFSPPAPAPDAGPSGKGEFERFGCALYFKVADIKPRAHWPLKSPSRPSHLVAKMPDHELWPSFVTRTEICWP